MHFHLPTCTSHTPAEAIDMKTSKKPADKRAGGGDGTNWVSHIRDLFRLFARKTAMVLGTAWAFVTAALIIVVWAILGPTFHYSDTWQLVINTGTTIVTFLMVFLIQNTQNRDSKAVHLKLDELIHALRSARDKLVDLEKLSDDELDALEREFERVRKRAAETKKGIEKFKHTSSR